MVTEQVVVLQAARSPIAETILPPCSTRTVLVTTAWDASAGAAPKSASAAAAAVHTTKRLISPPSRRATSLTRPPAHPGAIAAVSQVRLSVKPSIVGEDSLLRGRCR